MAETLTIFREDKCTPQFLVTWTDFLRETREKVANRNIAWCGNN